MIRITVGEGGYPCWVRLIDENGDALSIRHTELLRLEHAIAEAKRQVLCNLPRKDWHEVDPKLASAA